jgi:hypothetical protein
LCGGVANETGNDALSSSLFAVSSIILARVVNKMIEELHQVTTIELLIPMPNAVGRWGNTVKLSPEGSMKRNN